MKTVFIIVVIFFAACATSSKDYGKRVEKRFPTQKEIEKLSADQKTGYLTEKKPGKTVERWDLVSPLPSILGAHTSAPNNEFEVLLQSKSKKNLTMTDAMNCVAKQIGAFQLTHHAEPFQSLKRFIHARCGSTATQVQSAMFEIETLSESEAYIAAAPSLSGYFDSLAKNKNQINVGVAYVKNETKSLVMVSYEQPLVVIKATSIQAPAGGLVLIEGHLQNGTTPERFSASFNRGDFDVGQCLAQPAQSPAFKFVCQLDTTDTQAYFQISAQKKDALIANLVSQFVVFPSALQDHYEAPAIRKILHDGSESTAADTQKLQVNDAASLTTLANLINRVRTQGGRPAIVVDLEQSKTVQSLTAPLFNVDRDDVKKTNDLAMGIIAGWKVNGEIVEGTFTSDYVDTTSPVLLIEDVLEMPSGRGVLLSPAASAFSFGALTNNDNGMGFVFSSYDFLKDQSSNKRNSRVMEALNRERKRHGKSDAKERKNFRAKSKSLAKRLGNGTLSIYETTNRLMNVFLKRTGRKQVRSAMHLVPNLDDMSFVDELMEVNKLRPAIVVAPYRPENSPWTFYAVIIVY